MPYQQIVIPCPRNGGGNTCLYLKITRCKVNSTYKNDNYINYF